jgi:GNAT superfamily N-acetyltransferase
LRVIAVNVANDADAGCARRDGAAMTDRAWRGAIIAGAPAPISIRTAGIGDLDRLADHFGALSPLARYDRFMGAVDNFAKIAVDCLVQGSRAERFTLVAEWQRRGRDVVIGEASYAFDHDRRCGEFAVSVADRWQRQGIGSALLCALQYRAISLGYAGLFGETLKSNVAMKDMARKAGFEFSRSSDWRAIRFDKTLDLSIGLSATGPEAGSPPRARHAVA